jgi:hypothetical protein
MKMQMFAIYAKEKPDTENIRDLNLGRGQAYDRSSEYTAVVA